MFTMNDTNTILAKLLIQRTCKARRERETWGWSLISSVYKFLFLLISHKFSINCTVYNCSAMHITKLGKTKLGCQSWEILFPLIKFMTCSTARSSAVVTDAKFCRNSSAVGLSPSMISVTAFTNIAGTFSRSAT